MTPRLPKAKPSDFIATHPLFTKEEFVRALGESRTRDVQLDYYRKRGRLLRVRRGLYATVPVGLTPETLPLDPLLIAGKLTDDAVIGYHGALVAHGKAQSHRSEVVYLTERGARRFDFRGTTFVAVRPSTALRTPAAMSFGVESADRQGVAIRVTTLERTLVDILDRLDLAGGWEEAWTSLEAIEYFELEAVIRYVELLGNATTAAKVGYFLEAHRRALMVEDAHLERLKKRRPRGRHSLTRGGKRKGRWVSAWNLVLPSALVERAWKEPM